LLEADVGDSVKWRICSNLALSGLEDRRMGVSNQNLFVVSGGPGSGKTTVLHELASLGFAFAREVARQIIREQVQSGGTALPWRDREAYTRLMLQ